MYAQCPECLSVFSLGAQALVQAHGYVLCGHCGAGFDSLATLSEQLPPEPFREMPLNEQALAPPRIELVVYRPQRPAPEPVVVAEAAPAAAAEDFSQLVFAPRFAMKSRKHKPPRTGRRPRAARDADRQRRWPWVLVCVALAIALAGEVAWIDRDDLVRTPLAGGLLRGACDALGCRLPLVAAPKQLRLLASNVETHPNAANALMISLSLRNDAAFAQPWPVVVVTLSDAQGHRLSMRRLLPTDYLDDPVVLSHGLAPGATTALLLEVQDPGEAAVAYQFDFE
ncbi:zinc-ribbon and DUF3426 domain-containing protein [Rhodanobacter sp. DHB23]|uniref:zinc-ribbon and DUF3426 domain-containing protein n=1 Tax=Rhodanobacter sp. DHB23 TaxID=2775923 RepID=UPI00177B4BCA|nr:zinc-ribbon and DUF3426 domain-containing protein [Rhodanobacter sp. DHB23]MBD8872168.1 DUF3426 domain-containing protein [Rhodanobacter sp. DHB23]